MFIDEEQQKLFEEGIKKYLSKGGDPRVVKGLKKLAKLNNLVEDVQNTPIDYMDVVGERYFIHTKKNGNQIVKEVGLEELLLIEYKKVTKNVQNLLAETDEEIYIYFKQLGNAIVACSKFASVDITDLEEYTVESDETVGMSVDINPTDPFELHKRLLMFKLICGLKMETNFINSSAIDEVFEETYTDVVCNNVPKDLKTFVKTKK